MPKRQIIEEKVSPGGSKRINALSEKKQATDEKKAAETQPTTVEKIEDKAQLRLRGLLHVALNGFYLQSTDDIYMSLGRKLSYEYDLYDSVINEDIDIYDVHVLGYNAQGKALPIPDPKKYHTPGHFEMADAQVSFVKLSWITSHLVMAPHQRMYSPDFNKGVALVKRSAETMFRVSDRIYQTAIDLANGMGIKDKMLMADKAAKDALAIPTAPLPALVVEDAVLLVSRIKENNPPRPFTAPRLANDFVQLVHGENAADPSTKDTKRRAFESEVFDVFSFGVCIAYDNWKNLGDIMLSSTTHLRKCYDEMTPEESTATGSVVLQTVMDMLKEGHNEKAIVASLAAARALKRNASRLEAACAAVADV